MKKAAAYSLIALAAMLALFALGTALLDLLWAGGMKTPNPNTAGLQMGVVIGVVIRSAILGGVAIGLFIWASSLLNPTKFSAAAVDADALRGIYARENLATRTFAVGASDPYYQAKSDAELSSIYEAIDRKKVPDRYAALLAVIKARVEAIPQEPVAAPSEPPAPSPPA